MLNYRGGGSRFREVVTAAAARISGQAVIENGFAGVAELTAASGVRYPLRRDGEFTFPITGTPGKGDDVFINTTTFALTTAAHGTAPVAGTQLFGRVTAIPGNPNTSASAFGDEAAYGGTYGEPAAGNIWITIGSGGAGA